MRRFRRPLALGALTTVVALLHGALLRGTPPRSEAVPQRTPALQVRQLAPPVTAPTVQTADVHVEPPPRRVRRAAAAPPEALAVVAPVAATSGPAATQDTPVVAAAAASDDAAPARGSVDDAAAPPVYPTRVAPAFRQTYTLTRGALTGDAELVWHLDAAGRYEARLEGRFAGVVALDWASRGAIDDAGIAPERFVVRRGRRAHAANFQRAARKVTFSGPAIELPLVDGAQDRLTWMVQLPAIVAATPERFAAGAHVLVHVVGARGDADVWRFVVLGQEAVATPHGHVPALKLMREPRRPYDTRVEVWLDPAQHHLPVRARLGVAGRDDTTELTRQ